jgi:hypothetical protein
VNRGEIGFLIYDLWCVQISLHCLVGNPKEETWKTEREIQSGERPATTPVPNSAREEVTRHVKPERGSDRAITQVKVLSHEN